MRSIGGNTGFASDVIIKDFDLLYFFSPIRHAAVSNKL